jgi:type I restriction enzyme S subunit
MRQGWDELPLGQAPLQIIDGDRGNAYPKHGDFSDDGYCLFLSATNVTSSGFDFSEGQFISEQKDEELRKGRLARQDVVLTTRGTLGNAALYGDDVPYDHVRINSGMVIMRADPTKLRPAFLYGFLRSPAFKRQVEQLRSGVAQPQLPIRDINKIKLPLPRKEVQERIVAVFAAYDDLIESNRRRMALLEEAARQLYREWFVRLRFPGHEHTPITNGLPEGWERKPLGEFITLNYGKALKADDRVEGGYPVFGSSGIVGTHEKPLVQGPGIIVGRKGNIGSVYWSGKSFYPIDTVYFVEPERSDLYLYYALKHMHFISTDVAVPGLNRDFAYSRFLLIPPKSILREFLETATPFHAQMEILNALNARLRAARNLLLPRLMSGEIAV